MPIYYKKVFLLFSIVFFTINQPLSSQTMNMPMNHSTLRDTLLTNDLNGSGTSWLPEFSAIYGLHSAVGKWTVMNHGSVYLRFTDQNVNNQEKRGESAVDAPNWIMTMWDRNTGNSNLLRLRGMLSLDPLTEGGDGYPLLFQTGEAFKGSPLIDRQHPHDLFMELSATWFNKITDHSTFFAYFGLPGEPALGPATYMHRPSADMNPDAPLGHHWQDATHITFGVFTLGFILQSFKVDASIFTGREPDENRWNFDQPKFDSYSGRLSYQFTPEIESQISAGYLRSPETLHEDIDQVRITGSIVTAYNIKQTNTLSSSFVYGGNIEMEHGNSDLTNSLIIESELALNRLIPYGRYEFVQKKGLDLGIMNAEEEIFNIHEVTFGTAVRIADFFSLSFFSGAQGTMNLTGERLQTEYGKFPLSYEIYIRIRPQKMTMPNQLGNLE